MGRWRLRNRRSALCFGLLLTMASVSAQESQAAETSPTNRIGLVEAVRQTLSLDPGIQIQQSEIEASRGQVMAASGAFDLRLT